MQLHGGLSRRLLLFRHLPALIRLVFPFTWLDREKDEDEGIPSETEDDKRQLETKAKEMRGERTRPEPCFGWKPRAHALCWLSASAAQIC